MKLPWASWILGLSLAACGGRPPSYEPEDKFVARQAEVDFGLTFCGSKANTRGVEFDVYVSDEGHTWTATLGKGAESPFSLDAVEDVHTVTRTLQSRRLGSEGLAIWAKPIPDQLADLPGDFGDTLTVTSDVEGATPSVIPLKQGAKGALLRWSSTSVSFGSTPVGGSKTREVQLINDGNVDLEVKMRTSGLNDFYLWPDIRVAIAPGDGKGQVSFTPERVGAQGDILHISFVYTPVCGPIPEAVTLTGTGT